MQILIFEQQHSQIQFALQMQDQNKPSYNLASLLVNLSETTLHNKNILQT